MSVLLFVYGTLKRGCQNHAQMAGQAYVGEARTVPGFRLFDVGGYPGLVPWPEDRDGVDGEIWNVDASALARLDAFEGVDTGLYVRRPLPLQAPHAHLVVEGYLYPAPVAGRREIGNRWTE
jgi:gamma-glutamylcyclotransferase (GGCT)/AIG2-like uncharacterized protein YtfP